MSDTPATPQPRNPGRRHRLFKWLVVSFSVVATIGLLELASRWWLVAWHQELGNRHMQPYFMSGGYFQTAVPGIPTHTLMIGSGGPETYGYSAGGGTYVFGFDQPVRSIADRGTFLFQDRVDLADAAPDPSVTRIFVLGGSVAYGVGATQKDRRWYVLLERSLSAALKADVRVVPAAMVGHVSTQERIALELMVLPRSPDAVIILDGWNDVALPALFGTRPGDPYDQGILYGHFYSALGGFKKWLAQRSYLVRYLSQRSIAKAIEAERSRLVSSPERLATYVASTSSVYVDNLKRMLGRCQDAGIPCHAFLQPARDSVRASAEGNPAVVAGYAAIQQQAGQSLAGLPFADLSALLKVEAFNDAVHFGDAGQAAVAEAMHPLVLKMLADRRK